MKKTRVLLAALVGCALMVGSTGCASADDSEQSTDWFVTPGVAAPAKWVGAWQVVELPEGAPAELAAAKIELTPTDFSVTVGCNGMNGTYEVVDGRFSLITGAATEMSCGPEIDAAERLLQDAIRGATLYGDALVLETPHGDLEFKRSS